MKKMTDVFGTRSETRRMALARHVCFLLVGFLGTFAANAGEAGPAKVRYEFPSWVSVVCRGTVSLPPAQSPLEHVFAVKPGYEVHFCGEITQASAKEYNAKSGVFVINFYDANHNDVEQKALRYNSWLKGYLFYLGGSVKPIPFCLEIKVPERAVKAKIRVARLDSQLDDVRLTRFSRANVNPDQAFRKVFLIYCLFAFSLIVAWRLRKKQEDAELVDCTTSTLEENTIFKLWRFCAAAVAIIMACVFFREVYVVIGQNLAVNLLPLSGVLGVFMALMVFTVLICTIAKGRFGLSILIIMALCLVAHITVIRLTQSLYSQVMFSDFLQVERVVKNEAVRIAHRADFYYWCNYELLCSFLAKLFGKNIQVAQYLNALCCTAAVYPVFRVSNSVGGHRVAVFTSLLMGLSPVTQMYGTLLTGEFISSAAYSWSVYSIVRLLEEQSFNKKCVYALWSGVFLGIGNLAKPLAVVFLVALVIVVVFDIIKVKCRSAYKWLAVFSLFLGSYIFTYHGAQHVAVEVAKPQLIDISGDNEFSGKLLVGLNVETHGRFNRDWIVQWENLPSEERMSLLRHIIKKGYRKFPSLFLEKLDRAYSDLKFGWSWYARSIKTDVPRWVKSIVCIWNLIVLLLVAVGIMGVVMSGSIAKRRSYAAVLSLLVIAAFTLSLIVMECQPRYKMAIYPVFFFLIPYARYLVGEGSLMCRLVERCSSGAIKMWRNIARIVKFESVVNPTKEGDDGKL